MANYLGLSAALWLHWPPANSSSAKFLFSSEMRHSQFSRLPLAPLSNDGWQGVAAYATRRPWARSNYGNGAGDVVDARLRMIKRCLCSHAYLGGGPGSCTA